MGLPEMFTLCGHSSLGAGFALSRRGESPCTPAAAASARRAPPAPAPLPLAWAVCAAPAPVVQAGQSFRAAAGDLQSQPERAEAGVRPLPWTLPSACPVALLGLPELRTQ